MSSPLERFAHPQKPLALLGRSTALSDLYFGTGGSASWSETEGWDTLDGATTDPCEGEWYGVTCDEAGEHVVKLELNDNGLDGSLPDSIAEIVPEAAQ